MMMMIVLGVVVDDVDENSVGYGVIVGDGSEMSSMSRPGDQIVPVRLPDDINVKFQV